LLETLIILFPERSQKHVYDWFGVLEMSPFNMDREIFFADIHIAPRCELGIATGKAASNDKVETPIHPIRLDL